MKPTQRPSTSLLLETGMFLVPTQEVVHSQVGGGQLGLPRLPKHVGGDGGLLSKPVDKANMLVDRFDSKHFMNFVDVLPTCHPSTSFTTIQYWILNLPFSI